MYLVKAACWFVSKTSPVVQRKMTALYWARLASVNNAASSVASTVKLFVAANCWMAAMPSGMEAWRNSAVLENISVLNVGVCAWVAEIPANNRPARKNGVSGFNGWIIADSTPVVTRRIGRTGEQRQKSGGKKIGMQL